MDEVIAEHLRALATGTLRINHTKARQMRSLILHHERECVRLMRECMDNLDALQQLREHVIRQEVEGSDAANDA